MAYYEYTNIDFSNYQSIVHKAQAGDCIFNLGIWGAEQGHELDAIIQVSLDGVVWNNYKFMSLQASTPQFIHNILGVNMIRIYPEDNSILNYAVREYYSAINLRMIGPQSV